jgi:transposase
MKGSVCQGRWGFHVLRPVEVPPIPEATAALAWQVHPRGTDEMRVRDERGPLFTDADFTTGPLAGMFSGLGRPGLSPALLLMVMILQFRHNLSDRQAALALADRISWKYVLSLELGDRGFDHSVLSEFRSRLAQEGRADAVLDLMLARLKDAGLVKAGGRQRTDSSHVIACVRRLNRIETVGESLRAALEEIAEISPGFVVPLLKEGWDQRYGRKVEASRLLGRANASAQSLAEQIGADGQELLDAIDANPTAGWMNTVPKVVILRTVWDQQFAPARGGRPRLKDAPDLPPSAERIHSPQDPDARYSTKTTPGTEPDLEWVGTKCHLSESCDPDIPDLVTDVHTTPATDPDVTATTDIQDRLISRDLAPGQHLMDAGYPSSTNFAASAARGVTLVAPVIAQTGRNAQKGTFTPLDFTIDWEHGQARCPAGALSRSMRPDVRGLVTFRFRVRDCRPCPLRAKCTKAVNPDLGHSITVHPEPVHQARVNAHQAQQGEDWAKVYRLRAGVESTISQAVRGPGLRHSRYRGLGKVHVQNVLIGMALNITRLGAHFNTGDEEAETGDKERPCRPPTRVHRLCRDQGLTGTTAAAA